MRTSREIYKVAEEYRGKFINEVSWLEKFIDRYLAKHFVGDNQNKEAEMHFLLFGHNRISLDNKLQILDFIAKKHDLHWYTSYLPVIPRSSKNEKFSMCVDLKKIIEVRNILAHRIVDTSDFGLQDDEDIHFLQYNNDLKRFTLSHNDFSGYIFTIYALTKHFDNRLKS